MTWFDYILLGLWTLGAVSSVASVGKRRQPTTSGQAAFVVIAMLLLMTGLLASRGVFG